MYHGLRALIPEGKFVVLYNLVWSKLLLPALAFLDFVILLRCKRKKRQWKICILNRKRYDLERELSKSFDSF